MKKIIFALSALLSATLLAPLAQADHHLVFIRSVIKINNAQCAAELQISGDNQDEFQPKDKLVLDGDVLTDFTDLVGKINAEDGNNDTGDGIFITSNSFDCGLCKDAHADLTFADEHCEHLDEASTLQFVVVGPLEFDEDEEGEDDSEPQPGPNDETVIDTVDTADFPGFGNHTAILDETGSNGRLVNLDEEGVSIHDNNDDCCTVKTVALPNECSAHVESLIH